MLPRKRVFIHLYNNICEFGIIKEKRFYHKKNEDLYKYNQAYAYKTKKKGKITKAIEINKEILNESNKNVLDLIKIIEKNEEYMNIINYVTFFHRVMQIINKNKEIYIKYKIYINKTIEQNVNIIFDYLKDTNNSLNKINNYNKRLFSSFIWSYSKYISFLNKKNKYFSIDNKHKLLLNNKFTNGSFHNIINYNIHKDTILPSCDIIKRYEDINISLIQPSNISNSNINHIYQVNKSTNHKICNSHIIYKYSIFNKINIDLLFSYANQYLPLLNPSRYVIVFWSLSKLNKDNKVLHQKYYKKSVSLIPLLKYKELIILLYSYSYVNFSNFYFYLNIKNYILKHKIYKKIISERNYESLVNMLLSFMNQNILFLDLYENIVKYIIFKKTYTFINLLNSQELITLTYCLCKFPIILLDEPQQNNMNIEKKYIIINNNNNIKNNVPLYTHQIIFLYEYLKNVIIKRSNMIFKEQLDINYSIFYKSIINNNIYTLENLILIIWSLSFKHIYSAKLFLYTFIKLNYMMQNEQLIYNHYNILTNFYLSFLSFILEDHLFINLYFNKENHHSLNILYQYIDMFLDNFKRCKESINMNKRKYDVDISNMHKNIYQIINDIKFPNKINTILEYKNVHNISIDILLYKPNCVLQKNIFILNIIKDKYDTYNHCMYNNNSRTNTSYENLKINNILITMWNKNNSMIKSKEKGRINICKYFSSIINSSKNNIKGTKKQQKIKMNKNRKIINSNNIFNAKYIKSYFCTNVLKLSNMEKKNNNNDNLKNNKENHLFRFIEKIKNFHLENNKDQLSDTYKELHDILDIHIIYMKQSDIISFFYKFSSILTIFYTIKFMEHINELIKTFYYFHNFTFLFLKETNIRINLFIDICWIYFRYMKFLTYIRRERNMERKCIIINNNNNNNNNIYNIYIYNNDQSNIQNVQRIKLYNNLLTYQSCDNNESNVLLDQLNVIDNIFNIVKKKILEEDNIIKGISSKNMSFLISIFIYLNNSEHIRQYLEKNNFHETVFTIKDILFILKALSKYNNNNYNNICMWDIQHFFVNKFIDNIKNCQVQDLVDFTNLCAELKVNQDHISSNIKNKIMSYIYCEANKENKNIEKKKSILNHTIIMNINERNNKSIMFIELFDEKQLAFFVKSCYRMHCFDKSFFDLLCDLILKKYRTFHINNLCIALLCFSRIYCLHKATKFIHKTRDIKIKEFININKNKKTNIITNKYTNKKGDDYLEKNISMCRYDIPLSLKKLIIYTEKKLLSNTNIDFYNLSYFMESITLLKIQNKKLYRLALNETLNNIRQKIFNEQDTKLLGKILWCLSYYHKTEFIFSFHLIHFMLQNMIYKHIIPENFISIYLYFIQSRVYNPILFHNIAQVILSKITLNDYFTHNKNKHANITNVKLNVISELYATMSWAYAFVYNETLKKEETYMLNKEEKNEVTTYPLKKREKKIGYTENINDDNILFKTKSYNDDEIMYNDLNFIQKIYSYIFNEIKILAKNNNLSFLLLVRFLWGISLTNLISKPIINFINLYNWNDVNTKEQNDMHLHMLFTFWLRIKYDHSNLQLSKSFIQLKDEIFLLLQKREFKRNMNKNDHISDFHVQICQILDDLNIRYHNEYITKDLLSVDIKLEQKCCEHKLAIEIDGPSHHFLVLNEMEKADPQRIKKTYIKCGTTIFKHWLLQKSGWSIINVTSFEWNKINKDEKKKHIIKKLKEHGIVVQKLKN
ncbi:RAP protein, putative [Plasmodium reichenowi]|uniref:RAP protein, putative n=1 Tax=Plasmodium reichenowi TaxID=5854 RepID=A0A151L5G4_PLARE|nr:RAP protein, putative [Plasmodium reichenowi]KYN94186.1 RAP protein, putative [Plasmodium reichenowi]